MASRGRLQYSVARSCLAIMHTFLVNACHMSTSQLRFALHAAKLRQGTSLPAAYPHCTPQCLPQDVPSSTSSCSNRFTQHTIQWQRTCSVLLAWLASQEGWQVVAMARSRPGTPRLLWDQTAITAQQLSCVTQDVLVCINSCMQPGKPFSLRATHS